MNRPGYGAARLRPNWTRPILAGVDLIQAAEAPTWIRQGRGWGLVYAVPWCRPGAGGVAVSVHGTFLFRSAGA